jgi:hypothetical protein
MPTTPFPAHHLVRHSRRWCLAVLTVPSPPTMLCSLLPMLLDSCIVAALDDSPHSHTGIKLLDFKSFNVVDKYMEIKLSGKPGKGMFPLISRQHHLCIVLTDSLPCSV